MNSEPGVPVGGSEAFECCTLPKWSVGWGLTARCNMTCKFCYSAVTRSGLAAVPDVPEKIALGFIRRHVSRISSVNFGLGEATLHPAFVSIVGELRRLAPSVRVAVTTNGHIARLAVESPEMLHCIDEVDVSLDYCSPDAHDQSRGHPGAFRQALAAIDVCRSSGCQVSVVMIGTAATLALENVAGLVELCRSREVDLRVNLLRPRTRSSLSCHERSGVWRGLSYLAEHASSSQCSDQLLAPFVGHVPVAAVENGRSVRLLPDGSASPSTFLLGAGWLTSDVLSEGFRDLDALLESKPFRLFRGLTPPKECSECSFVSTCGGGAPDRRWLHVAGQDAPDPYCPRVYPVETEVAPRQCSSSPGGNVHIGYLPTAVWRFRR